MIQKTTQQISRICFAWPVTHRVAANRKCTAWFEILRSDDGETSFNTIVETRWQGKGRKIKPALAFENRQVGLALQRIKELGIGDNVEVFAPVVITAPPPWLDSLFESMAERCEAYGKSPSDMTEGELTALVNAAHLEATTPRPKPPPITLTRRPGVL